jgi:hypothetical protein
MILGMTDWTADGWAAAAWGEEERKPFTGGRRASSTRPHATRDGRGNFFYFSAPNSLKRLDSKK